MLRKARNSLVVNQVKMQLMVEFDMCCLSFPRGRKVLLLVGLANKTSYKGLKGIL